MSLTRRRFLQAAGLSAAVVGSPKLFAAAGAHSNISKLGIQLFTLGDEVGQNLEKSLKELAAIGYREIELPRLYGLAPRQIRTFLDATGITCPSIHTPFDSLFPNEPTLAHPETIIEAAHVIGITHVVAPIFAFPDRLKKDPPKGATLEDLRVMVTDIGNNMTVDEWKQFAQRLNSNGRLLAKSGLKMGFHNHNNEFFKPQGSKLTALEILLQETDPALVDFELDLGWVAAAGHDPAAFLTKHRDRITQLHLKDLTKTTPNTGFGMNPVVAGQGVIDWYRLSDVIEAAGHIEHGYVEQEAPFKTSRMEAARANYDYLSKVFAIKNS